MATRRRRDRLACVMGSMDLVRPLGLAGIPCVPVAPPGSEPLYSRFASHVVPCADLSSDSAELLEALMRFGEACPVQPTLFYEEDEQLLLVSRQRERLSQVFRFVIAAPTLVEDLVDKGRFQELAERLGLPVPQTRRVAPAVGSEPTGLDLRFPVIVKPLMRRDTWEAVGGIAKALEVYDAEELRRLWPRLAESGMEFLVQEMVPGPETRIESYHVYAGAGGEIAGEFTGRKIRTYPLTCGHSTSLTITDEPDVLALGRSLTEKLGLHGVAKFDFKRDPAGQLHLLEVNPRFNLWHHLGAVAGVNLPAIVYADLDGSPRPAPARLKVGASWCKLSRDLRAARESGISLSAWLAFALRCEARAVVSWDDPMPYLRSKLYRRFGGHAEAAAPAAPPRDSAAA